MYTLSNHIPNAMTLDFIPNISIHSFGIHKFPSSNTFHVKGWSTGNRAHKLLASFVDTLHTDSNRDKVNIRFEFETFDTTSVKYIFKIIKSLNALHSSNCQINATWIAQVEDEEMINTGMDFEKFCDFKLHYQLK